MSIEAEIERFIIDELEEENLTQIDPDESLIDRGFLDSVFVLRLIAFFEERFNVTVAQKDMRLDNFETISQMTSFLERKMNGFTSGQ